jgi:hypothetical protein
MSLTRSLITQQHHPILGQPPARLGFRQGQVLVDLPDDRVHPLSVKMQAEAGWGDPHVPSLRHSAPMAYSFRSVRMGTFKSSR